MLFSEQLKKEAKPIINQIYHDPFIQGMLHGNLPIEATKFYLRADASYLNEFANIYALLIPKMENLNDVRFLADYVQESYNEIVQEKVWPPSGDHYIKHMYFNAYAKENAAYTIAAMAPCPYVYQVIAQEALRDKELNKDSILAKWFEFYSTEMDELVIVFDNLMDKLTKHCSEKEKNEIKQCFLQSTVHERNFFNMSFNEESWSYGGMKNE